MRAEEMVKEYPALKRELQVLEFQISRFEGVTEKDIIDSMVFGHNDDTDRVQTSGTSDKTAKIALNYKNIITKENEEWFDFLWKRYRYIQDEIKFFEDCLKYMPNELGEMLMDLVNKEPWDEVADKYDISLTTLARYRKKAMKLLNADYETRDTQTLEFILS